jgi:tetratricopeptide (TPR) repeat protein
MLEAIAPMVDSGMETPLDVEKRFGHWDKVLAAAEPPEFLPISTAIWHADRAVAYAATKRPDEARFELEAFLAQRRKIKPDSPAGQNTAGGLLGVEEHLVRGELLVQAGDLDGGIAQLKAGVVAEDKLKYDEPADWMQPVRHTLGAALLKAGRAKEALGVYRADLKKIPNNGWSTIGMANAYAALGDAKHAAVWRKQAKAVWSPKDPKSTTSCACLKG